jgi:hypothetical protein
MLELAGNALVVVTTVLAWVFVVMYHVLAPWWRSEVGRHIMTYSALVAAVLTLSVVRMIGGAGLNTPWFGVVRLVVFAGVPVAISWRIAILWRAQRRGGGSRQHRR